MVISLIDRNNYSDNVHPTQPTHATPQIGVAYKLDGELLPAGSYPSTLEDLSRVRTHRCWLCS